jgi:hypothetical protein
MMLSRTNPTIVEMYTGLTTKWFYASFCVLRGKGSYFSIVLAVRSRSSYYCVCCVRPLHGLVSFA